MSGHPVRGHDFDGHEGAAQRNGLRQEGDYRAIVCLRSFVKMQVEQAALFARQAYRNCGACQLSDEFEDGKRFALNDFDVNVLELNNAI